MAHTHGTHTWHTHMAHTHGTHTNEAHMILHTHARVVGHGIWFTAGLVIHVPHTN